MTRQRSREGSKEREPQTQVEVEGQRGEMEKEEEESEAGCRARQSDAGRKLQRERAEHPGVRSFIRPGSPPTPSGPGPLTTSLLRRPPPAETPFRTRLMSPLRILRERSQSRERLRGVSPHVNEGEVTGEVVSSSRQDERRGRAEQRGRRSLSPNPFLWLCRDRHARTKSV